MVTNIMLGVLGLLLLILGRRLFWLFVAAVGVAAGVELARQHLVLQPYWVVLLVGLAAGIAGALLAIFFQKVAIAFAGLAAGGSATAHLMAMLGYAPVPLITLAGAVAGAVILYLLFDWGLIALSALAGATLIAQAWPASPHDRLLIFQALTLAGILIQSFLFIKQKHRHTSLR